MKRLQKAIAEYMDRTISFYDAGAEGFYHGLTLGLVAFMMLTDVLKDILGKTNRNIF